MDSGDAKEAFPLHCDDTPFQRCLAWPIPSLKGTTDSEMSLFKRNDVWGTRFTTPDGKRIRKSTGTIDKKQAQEFEDTTKAKYWRVAQLGEKPRRTWQQAAIRWPNETRHKVDHENDNARLIWLNKIVGKLYLDQIDRDVIDSIASTKMSENGCAPV